MVHASAVSRRGQVSGAQDAQIRAIRRHHLPRGRGARGRQPPPPDAAAGGRCRGARGARRRKEAGRGQDLRRHRPHAPGARRQPRPDRVRDRIELPDKYVRKDEIPAQESGPTTSGFNGETCCSFRRRRRRPRAPAGRLRRRRSRWRRPAGCGSARVEAGFRAADARHVRRIVAGLSADLHLRRQGRGAAGQGRRARRQRPGRARRLCRAPVHQRRRRTCRSW